MTCGIYSIRCKVTDDLYIGSSVNIKQRWDIHRSLLRHHKHGNKRLSKIYDLYLEDNFEYRILIECEKEELISLEQEYINSMHPSLNIVHSLFPLKIKASRRYTDILLVSPDGVIYTEITNLNEFCREHNLPYSHIYQILNYAIRSRDKCKGWYLIEPVI